MGNETQQDSIEPIEKAAVEPDEHIEATPHTHANVFRGLVVLALVAILAVCGTVAFTVNSAPVNNVITFGDVKLQVREFTLNDQGNETPFLPAADGSYPSTKVTSGNISRIVRMENTGEQPLYVRARLSLCSVSPDGGRQDATGAASFSWNDAQGGPWVDGGDGWYYYRGLSGNGGVVEPGQLTERLIDSLRFVGDYYTASKGGSFQLKVDAQAVQAKNQSNDVNTLDVLDVQGWPETR